VGPPRADGLPSLGFVFLANGAALASWYPHLPAVQRRLAVGPAALGLALLGLALGALVAMPLSGFVLHRVGSRTVVAVTALGMCLTLPLPALARSVGALGLSLCLLGAFCGALDVSMNAHAVGLERALGRPILSRLHALFPLGGLLGAGLAALAIDAGLSPLRHLSLSAATLGAGILVALAGLSPVAIDAAGGPVLARPGRAILPLGLVAFCGLMAEGAMGDWTAIWLHGSLGASEAVAACAFAAFSLAMAAGRATGDHAVVRRGSRAVLQRGGLVAAASLILALVAGSSVLGLAGCLGVGFGMANVIPVVFRRATEVPGLPPGYGLAATTTVGYCGLLAGPPLVGFVASVAGLPVGLGLVVVAALVVALLA